MNIHPVNFKVHEISGAINPPLSYQRRDYYKIVLATGDLTIGYGDQTIDINDTFLFFSNPHVPYSVVQRSIKKKRLYLSVWGSFYCQQGTVRNFAKRLFVSI